MFRFKQFRVTDDGATMRVGTDGVLVAALAPTLPRGRILDIGTGCGVVALILAQHNPNSTVDAVEIDGQSAAVAAQNFANSPWSERLRVFGTSAQEFARTASGYDLIVSNPPFFADSLKSPHEKRNLARHNDSLTFDELATAVKQLLSPEGRFTAILPCNEADTLAETARNKGLFLLNSCNIYSKPQGNALRKVITMGSMETVETKISELYIHNSDGSFSEQYRSLTSDLYLWEK